MFAALPPRATGPSTWRVHMAAQDMAAARAEGWKTEHDFQVALVNWTRHQLREGGLIELALIFAIPNGSNKSKATAGKFKAEGLRSGIPDLCLPLPSGGYHSAYLELKLPGNKPSENQEAWLDLLESYNHRVAVVYSLAAARNFLTNYLTP